MPTSVFLMNEIQQRTRIFPSSPLKKRNSIFQTFLSPHFSLANHSATIILRVVNTKTVISCEDLHRSYKIGKNSVQVLNGITLEIKQAEKVFLCGASGAGKTTLMYSLAGLEKPQKGRVIIDDTDLYALSRSKQSTFRNQHIGYIFQNYFLLPELTALENVIVPSMISGKNAKQRATELMEKVGLSHRMNHLPAELSGGEQQRVAIARSLINSPSILFADEPTGNLDSNNGDDIIDLLFSLSAEDQTTLVIVTHDRELAKKGDRIINIKDGLVL